jgi:hypothetical protein
MPVLSRKEGPRLLVGGTAIVTGWTALRETWHRSAESLRGSTASREIQRNRLCEFARLTCSTMLNQHTRAVRFYVRTSTNP